MNSRQRKPRESLAVTALSVKTENEGGGNKGNDIPDEILTAYNTYLHARCLQKIQEYRLEKVKCGIKKKKLELEREEARLEALRRRKLEIQYLSETSNMLVKLSKHLASVSSKQASDLCRKVSGSYPAYILDDLPKIRNNLLHKGNQLPVMGAIVAPDESEKIMETLPHVKQTLEKLQDSLDNKDEVHKVVANMCTTLVNNISGIIEIQKRYDNLVEEMVSLGLRVSAMNILKSRDTGSSK